jgi:hypothetical protein
LTLCRDTSSVSRLFLSLPTGHRHRVSRRVSGRDRIDTAATGNA